MKELSRRQFILGASGLVLALPTTSWAHNHGGGHGGDHAGHGQHQEHGISHQHHQSPNHCQTSTTLSARRQLSWPL